MRANTCTMLWIKLETKDDVLVSSIVVFPSLGL